MDGNKSKKTLIHKSGPFFFFLLSQFSGSFNTHLNTTSSFQLDVLSAAVYNSKVVREKCDDKQERCSFSLNHELKDSSCVGSARQEE